MSFLTSRVFNNPRVMEAVANASYAYLPRIGCLRISNFRCHSFREFNFRNTLGPVVFTGANGVGKTTVLEAVSLFAPGKGMKRAKLRDMIANKANSFGVYATLGEIEIGTGANIFSGSERVVKINGRVVKEQSELLKYVKILWLSPEIERSFASDVSSRRKFFDRAVSCFDDCHIHNLVQYGKALKEWSNLLKNGVDDDTWLEVYEKTLVKYGNMILRSRRIMADMMNLDMEQNESSFPKAFISFDISELKNDYFTRRRSEFLEKGFIEGAHNQKIEITDLKTGNTVEKCSTGEVKSSLVSIFLSQTRLLRDKGLILLLDDVSAYLDAERRDNLLKEISGMKVQSFITGVDINAFKVIKNAAEFFAI